MSTLKIILLVAFAWFVIMTMAIFAFHIFKTKLMFKSELVKGHRDLWIFYHENYDDLKEIFSDNTKAIEINQKQSIFLVMLFNHMELSFKLKQCDMLPRTGGYGKDYKGAMSNKTIRKFWEKNRIYRDKSFARCIDKLLNEEK